jgi:hypothetical protein
MVDPGTLAYLEQSAQMMHRTAEGMLRAAKTARRAGYSAFADRMEGRAREMLRLTDDFDPAPVPASTVAGNGRDPV